MKQFRYTRYFGALDWTPEQASKIVSEFMEAMRADGQSASTNASFVVEAVAGLIHEHELDIAGHLAVNHEELVVRDREYLARRMELMRFLYALEMLIKTSHAMAEGAALGNWMREQRKKK